MPRDAVSATISLTALADNQAVVSINGVVFGRQADSLSAGNFTDADSRFTTTFAPDPSGVDRLRVTLWDGGGALGLEYVGTVTYQTAAGRRKDSAAGGNLPLK